MIRLIDFLLESQASDDAKRQGLEYMRFGRYGKDGKVTHKSVDGKLQPVKGGDATGKASTAAPAETPEKEQPAEPKAEPTSDKSAQIVSKVKDKIQAYADENYETWEERGGEDIPTAEFSKMTGIPEDALRVYGRSLRDPEEDGIYYDTELDTFSLGGFPDRIIKQFLGPVADRTGAWPRR